MVSPANPAAAAGLPPPAAAPTSDPATADTLVTDGASTGPAPDDGLARRTMYGAKLLVGLTFVTRGTSFFSQLVLGYILLETDFGLYGAALSLSAMVSVLRDAGVGRYLIQRHDEYARLARPVSDLALAFNVLAAVGIVLIGLGAGHLKNSPQLPWMMALIAASVVIRSPTVVYRARLMSEMRFGELWRVDVIGLPIRHGLTILLALLGAGATSFVAPLVAVAAYELVALRRAAGAPPGRRLDRATLGEILGTTKWIMFGAAGIALVMQGDYLSVWLLKGEAVLGLYYFGFQMASSVSQVFTGSLSNVLMPALTRARSDPARLRRGFTRALGLMALTLSFVGMLGTMTAPAMIHVLWPERWEGAVPAAVAVFATLMIRSVAPLSLTVAEATGRWKLRALLLAVDAAGTILFAAAGAMLGGVLAISVAIAVHRVAWGVFQCSVGARLAGGRATDVVVHMGPSVAIGLVSAAAGLAAVTLLGLPMTTLAGGAVAGATFAATFGLLTLVAARPQIRELRELAPRRRAADDAAAPA